MNIEEDSCDISQSMLLITLSGVIASIKLMRLVTTNMQYSAYNTTTANVDDRLILEGGGGSK